MARKPTQCGYCGGYGHNRQTCQSRAMNEGRVTHKPVSYRIGVARRRSRCSYCGEVGHNRKTCQTIVRDKKLLVKENARVRPEILKHMKANRYAPGALVKYQSYDGEVRLFVVIAVRWDNIDCFLHDDYRGGAWDCPLSDFYSNLNRTKVNRAQGADFSLQLKRITDGPAGFNPNPSCSFPYGNYNHYNNGWKIVSGGNPDKLNPPKEWLDGTLGANKFFEREK